MKLKKSQITLFIILGLVLLFIIGFLFYLTKYVVKKQSGHETTKTQKIKIELQPIENYVTQCLDKVTKEGLVLLGKQGGYLYTSQGGPQGDFGSYLKGFVFLEYPSIEPHQVAYGIVPLGSFTAGYYPETSDKYPWEFFPYIADPATTNVETFEGLFGENRLPFIDSGPKSIKSQLEFYIKNNVKDCIDLGVSDFEEQGYEITRNNLNVNLEIAKNDLAVRLTYPLTIKNKVTGDTTTMQDFFVREQIRLKKIYNTANNLIDNDIQNINFHIKNDASLESGFSVDIAEDVYDKDDVIIVEDANSLINNKPYEFIFARRNRMPALHYIYNPIEPITKPDGYEIQDTDLIPGGIANLEAFDPDEDQIDSSSFSINPNVPKFLTVPSIDFKIKVTDGELEDYQIIKVIRT